MARRAIRMRDVDMRPRAWVAIVLSMTLFLVRCPALAWASAQNEGVPAAEAVALEPCDVRPDDDAQCEVNGETAAQAAGEGSEQTDSAVQAPEDEMWVAAASDAPGSGFAYAHGPLDNPKAMADIIEDASAVYGFRPSAEGSLAAYAGIDWTDPAVVEEGRRERIAYHESINEMYDMLYEMQAAGASTEEIARAVSAKRNEIRIASYANNPEGLERLKARNLEIYGNENGGSPEYFYERYGSWETVIDRSFSTNSGMDACLGLYDDYYPLYVILGQVAPTPVGPDPAEESDETGGDDRPTEADDPADEGWAPTATGISSVGLGTSPTSVRPAAQTAQALPATGDVDVSLPLELALAGGLLVGLGMRFRTSS